VNKLKYKLVKQNFFLQQQGLLVFFLSGSMAIGALNKFIIQLEFFLKRKLTYLKLNVDSLRKKLYKHSF